MEQELKNRIISILKPIPLIQKGCSFNYRQCNPNTHVCINAQGIPVLLSYLWNDGKQETSILNIQNGQIQKVHFRIKENSPEWIVLGIMNDNNINIIDILAIGDKLYFNNSWVPRYRCIKWILNDCIYKDQTIGNYSLGLPYFQKNYKTKQPIVFLPKNSMQGNQPVFNRNFRVCLKQNIEPNYNLIISNKLKNKETDDLRKDGEYSQFKGSQIRMKGYIVKTKQQNIYGFIALDGKWLGILTYPQSQQLGQIENYIKTKRKVWCEWWELRQKWKICEQDQNIKPLNKLPNIVKRTAQKYEKILKK